ncbi:Repeat domain-containing protein [Nitrosomonas sp. Nm51]|uniref:CRTAC1 family protein n=1 Tax=Nitrosomonas sp. Nm51 TaxID=133720 RepID=UPI0008AFFE57|nr:CRTAC1 family protein [Nitrosomonas sp. Nm51]SEQ98262.1 Repeat domain-containing protein [Nitrosomonas sp. Nm51]
MTFNSLDTRQSKQLLSLLKTSVTKVQSTVLLISVLSATSTVAGSIKFHDIAADPSSGLNYERTPSLELTEILDTFNAKGVLSLVDDPSLSALTDSVNRPEGSPGIAILDYDGDGDQDIYVTNGPGTPNSLFKNQFKETGELTFVDVGMRSGAGAISQDSAGVCYGDIDNDGDLDLYVLGRSEPNLLFENQGNGRFVNITETARMGAGNLNAQVCAMGDVNGDGLLDIVVGNSYNFNSNRAMFVEPYALNEPDQLFLNQGDNTFADISESSGIRDLAFPAESLAPSGASGITWSIAMVDYDQDGHIDIIIAHDQGAFPHAQLGGLDRGFIHFLKNDGSGNFTDVTGEKKMFRFGAWMGLDFGDFNCDGLMDIFATNQGDYFVPFTGTPYHIGEQSSRWLLGMADGTFSDPGVGDLMATPFGWGTTIVDYDNDGDQDIVFHGGLNMFIALEASNPGVILNNQECSATFEYDLAAKSDTDHSRRAVLGVAVADLNQDGFSDIVSVSNYDTPEPNPLIPAPPAGSSEFDATAYIVPTWLPGNEPGQLIFNPGILKTKGSLSVEINSGGNNNGWAAIALLGTAGLTDYGRVNRNGIGAIVSFQPENGLRVIKPLLAGSSHASQNSLELLFGMGKAKKGTVDILWPGGVRNRLYDVATGERISIPEIPCSYDAQWENRRDYTNCVRQHLFQLKHSGLITIQQLVRLDRSARRAYRETQNPND